MQRSPSILLCLWLGLLPLGCGDQGGGEDELGAETKAVLYCLTGPMNAIAAGELIELGDCQIYDMPAGMVGWEAEGYPLDP